MESNNQKIVFSVSEETTPAEIIIDILSKNGFKDPGDDLIKNDRPRVVIVHDAAKDLFDKKITEEKMSALFQSDLKVSKEVASSIISELKSRLIPYGKKVIIALTTVPLVVPGNLGAGNMGAMPIGRPKIQPMSDDMEPFTKKPFITNVEEMMPSGIVESAGVEELKPSLKKAKRALAPNKTTESAPRPERPKGPDNYREPIA